MLRTLALAHGGASLDMLANQLAQEYEVSPAEALEFLHELVQSQVLVPEIIPKVTGTEPVPVLSEYLSRVPGFQDHSSILTQALESLAAIDAEGIGQAPESYKRIAETLRQLGIPVELPRLFQVDLYKPTRSLSLGPDLLSEIGRGIGLMARMRRALAENPLREFAERFVARYENREVPLVEALDDEMGIGFGSSGIAGGPLVDGLAVPRTEGVPQRWFPRQSHLLQKLCEAVESGAQEIALDDRDVEQLTRHEAPPLPDSFTVVAKVAAASMEALDRGDYRVKFQMVNSPAVRLFGRFCHGSPDLHRLTKQLCEAEEALDPDAIHAEIVHLPEGRIGNIMLRPTLRRYEIPYLGRASVDQDYQIPISDLLVSVRQGQVILRSRRLGKRVIPRMATAHNYLVNSPTIYRFLCTLETAGVSGEAGIPWGPLAWAPFLPRVVYGRLVLSLAQWRVRQSEWLSWGDAGTPGWYRAVQEWRKARRIPRWAVLVDGDNTLPVDFHNILSLESLLQVIKNRDGFVLEELFPPPNELVVQGPEGVFTHEIVIPYTRSQQDRNPATRAPEPPHVARRPSGRAPVPAHRRSFGPGSEWLYAKIYTGIAGVDEVLRTSVRPVVRLAMEAGAADRWFFIRYGDPDWHLRLRFHGDPERLLSIVLPALRESLLPLLENRRVWKWQLDTYEREVERYGGLEGVLLAEQLFWADSEAVLDIVSCIEGDQGEELRWRLALVGMDRLLQDLFGDLQTKLELARAGLRSFAQEFRVDGRTTGEIGDRFRKVRDEVGRLLTTVEHSPWGAIFRRRTERMKPIISRLQEMEEQGEITVPLRSLATSYLHMHVNRLIRSKQRMHELVLYDYLTRIYRSEIARAGADQ